jgi:3-hydroxyisobutyrate dehydrogenase-like beta-hydroxyacid dehydrogenase
MTTALIGTGLLGTAIAEGMLARGEALVIWNRTPEKTVALAARGAKVASTLEAAVNDADRVHLVVSDDAAVDAILAKISPRGVVIDHTTTLPRSTKERAERCKARNIELLSAPCFMTPTTAREAKGMILASGQGYTRVKDALAAMTGDVWYLGERAELAVSYKLCGNAVQVAVAAALADVIAIARGAGIDPNAVAELFSRYDVVRSLPTRAKKMARGDMTPSWNLAMARKDVGLMIETANEPVAILPAIAQRMDEMLAEGHAADDYGAVALPALKSS